MNPTDNLIVSANTNSFPAATDNVTVSLFNYNFKNLLDVNYLFDQSPESFIYSTWALVLGALGIVLAILIILFLKKRREKLYVPKSKRKFIGILFKVSLVSSILFTLSAFLRTQNVAFVSMRIWLLLFGLINIVVYLASLVIYFKKEKEQAGELKSVRTDEVSYTKYLPKKKKK